MSESVVTIRSARRLSCPSSCAAYKSAKDHHDRLLIVDQDVDALIDLFDLAVTWGELDYSGQRLVEPAGWSDFVSTHRWQNVERAAQIFQLAIDVALRSGRMNVRDGTDKRSPLGEAARGSYARETTAAIGALLSAGSRSLAATGSSEGSRS